MSDDAKTTPDESARPDHLPEPSPAGASSDSDPETLEIAPRPKRPAATVVDDGSPIADDGEAKAVFLGAAAAAPLGAGRTHVPGADEGRPKVTRTLDESETRILPLNAPRRPPPRGGSPWLPIVLALIGVGGIVAVVVAKWPASTAPTNAKDVKTVRTPTTPSAQARPVTTQENAPTPEPPPATDPRDTPNPPPQPAPTTQPAQPGPQPAQPNPVPGWIPTVLPSVLPPFPSAFPAVLPSTLPPLTPPP